MRFIDITKDFPMNDNRSRLEKGYYYKTYKKFFLLDENWEQRVRLIEEITSQSEYPTKFHVCHTHVVRSIHKLPARFRRIEQFNAEHARQLADIIDYMESCKFVHGDINPKNILCDGKQVVLIDFEPSLIQLIGRVRVQKYTVPYIHPIDFLKKNLSVLSDRMCFAYWACGLDLKSAAEISSMGNNCRKILTFVENRA
jgi:serine/threonine protein kinase